jgi:hypothetical protein
VSDQSIADWLNQFDDDHLDLAARILDAVDFYSLDRISTAYTSSLAMIPGWNVDESLRKGQWRFAGLSLSAGESADAMMHRFRVANGLDARRFNSYFIHPSQILLQKLGGDDTIVLVDDFVGSGDSVCKAWSESFQELLAGIGRVYLLVVAAVTHGRAKVGQETSITCVPGVEFTDKDNLFHDSCTMFTAEEKQALLRYCKMAKKSEPKGYGNCGLLVSFQHRCPNNSVPILHATNSRWNGLFPRHG